MNDLNPLLAVNVNIVSFIRGKKSNAFALQIWWETIDLITSSSLL
jgi:hypothetical protein